MSTLVVYSQTNMKKIQRDWDKFLQPLSAQAQQARKIYTSFALLNNVSVLFSIDYKLGY